MSSVATSGAGGVGASASAAPAPAAGAAAAAAAVGKAASAPVPGDVPEGFTRVCEGRGAILFPKSGEVFYNPVQEFNRDLSVLVLNTFSKRFREETAQRLAKRGLKKASEGAGGPATAATSAAAGVKRSKGADEENEGDEGEEEEEDGKNEEEEAGEQGAGGEEQHMAVESSGDKKEVAAVGAGAGAGAAAASTAPHAAAAAAPPPDLSTAPGISILEALSATGLRAVRYFKEVEGVAKVTANDFSADAVAAIRRNIEYNGLSPEHQVVPSHSDASIIMYQHRATSERFDVIDIDPYGGASPFLDGAVQAVSDGGLLCVTCTDMAVLAGNHGETCHAKYGAMPLRTRACHEMALRIVLGSLSTHAARYRRYIVPVLSLSIDFYIRLFVRVYTSATVMKRAASKLGLVYQCTGCDSFALQQVGRMSVQGTSTKFKPGIGPPVDRQCAHCGSSFHVGGPIWMEPLHDVEFVKAALAESSEERFHTHRRIQGMLSVVTEELQDVPLYYTLNGLAGVVHCTTPPMLQLRSAIIDRGFRVSFSHANAQAVKTDAPVDVLWDIMRSWVAKQGAKKPANKVTNVSSRILAKEPSFQANFTVRADADPPSRRQGLSRYPENPEPNWGPKARAKKPKLDKGSEAGGAAAAGAQGK